MTSRLRSVVLAYSGGLDTSIIVPWLKETYGCRVIAFAADVGQGDEISGLARKAIASGADEFLVEDLREDFARDYLFPALAAGAVYEHSYLLGTALARPIIARCQVELALALRADGVAHGCTGKGNDQVRFELTYRALAPHLRVIAPWREWSISSREEACAYAAERGIPVPVSSGKLYSRDRNLWHCSHEGGPLEDPGRAPEPDLFLMTAAPEKAPDQPTEVTIGIEHGRPAALDGRPLSPARLIAALNEIAGAHGVGRVDLVENRLVGMKSRGVYETPGGTVLVEAMRALQSLTLDRDTARFLQIVGLRYADLAYGGQWFTPLRASLDALVATALETTTGEVTLRLHKGSAVVVGRRSPHSLYDAALGGFAMTGYQPADATGFISLTGLPLAVRAERFGPAAPLRDDTTGTVHIKSPIGEVSRRRASSGRPTRRDKPAVPLQARANGARR
jgi:argininosuccinate synthase